jgi:low temperature requirement protein LtrA
MQGRRTDEAHRAATPLELFFDLCFVVAVAQAAASLHHGLVDLHLADALVGYPMVFFAIWWAWMNFTWFASAYDCDDVPYRIAVLVQIVGVLILAAGVPRAFDEQDFGIVTLGYAVMRTGLVSQWLRAAHDDPLHRATALRYAAGISGCMAGWVVLLVLPEGWRGVAFLVMVAAELLVPVWAERAGATPWHAHHIAERYGLFTIIVLGESILAATLAIEAAVAGGEPLVALLPVILGGLLIVFSLWWIYFDRPAHDLLTSLPRAIVWGYGHYFIFASAAAVGAGLAVAIDQTTGHAAIGAMGAGFAVAIPVVVFVLSLWFLHYRPADSETRWVGPIAAPLILLTPYTEHAVLLTGVILAAIVALKVATGPADAAPEHG